MTKQTYQSSGNNVIVKREFMGNTIELCGHYNTSTKVGNYAYYKVYVTTSSGERLDASKGEQLKVNLRNVSKLESYAYEFIKTLIHR